ncbi:MAG: hypothetical protein GX951_04595 [Mollicutes bacterium]|nr:hypothetical protein [Mollicutes bacterium]
MNNKIKFKILYIIIILIYIMSINIGIILVRGQKDVSTLENRVLSKVPKFTFQKFLKGSYQKQLEDSLVDQALLGQLMKQNIKSFESNIADGIRRNLEEKFSFICERYKMVDNKTKVYMFGCNETLVDKPDLSNFREELQLGISLLNNLISGISNVKFYFYYIDSSRGINFNDLNNDIYYYLNENINIKNQGHFKINSFEDYNIYFYKTDHHWNYAGSQKAYEELGNMLEYKPIMPVELVNSEIKFYGSYSRNAVSDKYDIFCYYKYNLPEHNIYLGNRKVDFSLNDEQIRNGDFLYDKYFNYYAQHYAADHKEVIYDYKQNNRENLLVIKNSYFNAIQNLVAAHFNRTYIVDLRHYNNFNLDKYIREKNIDKVLFIGDYLYLDSIAKGVK